MKMKCDFNCDVDGKFLRLIKNLYNNIKYCLIVNGEQTEFFSCNVGLRQGENVLLLLFSIYLNDLESFFFHNDLNGGMECSSSNLDNAVYIYFKLFILLNANDTVLRVSLQSTTTIVNNGNLQ